MSDKMSRKIRQLIQTEGMTSKEIKKKLGLQKKKQISEIIEEGYSQKISNKILEDLCNNNYRAKTTLIVDTSALSSPGIIQYILSYHEVILIEDVVREMDQFKYAAKEFGENIRELLRISAEDSESNKVKIVVAKNVSHYVDDNLVNFVAKKSKKHPKKKYLILTADNGLACRIKARKIDYVLVKSIQSYDAFCSLECIKRIGETLYMQPKEKTNFFYIAIDKNGNRKKTPDNNGIPLEMGDYILECRLVSDGKKMTIVKYRLKNLLREECLVKVNENTWTKQQIDELAFSKAVKAKIKSIF